MATILNVALIPCSIPYKFVGVGANNFLEMVSKEFIASFAWEVPAVFHLPISKI